VSSCDARQVLYATICAGVIGARRLLFAILVAAGCLTVASVEAAPPAVRFPRDHFGHPAASIEWWYFTALVRDANGVRYSVFFTLFSSRGTLVPVAQVRNLETGALVGHSERLALGSVGRSSLDVIAGGARLRYESRSKVWLFTASGPGFMVSLHQRPVKPYALNGDGSGVIRQSLAGAAHYYSATRMRAAGTLHTDGKRLLLAGESWLDHQWGGYRNDPRAFNWDWFSCRFDDDSELMLYQFRDRATGRPLRRFRSGTYVPRHGPPIGLTNFRARPGQRSIDAAGRRWPIDWHLHVPTLSLTENLRSLVRDQLVRNRIVPTFWEGAARATGNRNGTCFVELSYR
jgi:predicted secreted hydrolase